ncbi:MAG TPA: hypothetical protein VFS42_08190 [Burkholderiaceae bacterium]|nr:hypothetical protein [Burkholderiaceae bacterium]
MKRHEKLFGALGVAATVVGLAGCASTRMDAEWTDPNFAGRSLRNARVLVACEAPEQALQRICQDELAARLKGLGAVPVIATTPVVGEDRVVARGALAQAVLRTTVAPTAPVVRHGPSIGIGLGGFNIGGGGGGVGIGGGVSVPVGGAHTSTGYTASSQLTDASTGQLIWTGKAIAPASDRANGAMDDLANAIGASIKRAGVME